MARTHRRVGLALAASLAIALFAGSPALGGNTRVVFFGSPATSSAPEVNGLLTTTDVTASGATAADILLQNKSGSELTHVVIQGGAAAPNPLANPSFPAPPPICTTDSSGTTTCIPSLPSGTSYLAAYVDPSSTAGATCVVAATSLSCSVANMAANTFVRIRVILQPPANAGANVLFWFATSVKEGTSNTGQNQDTFFAYNVTFTQPFATPPVFTNGLTVLAASCGEVANFFQRNQHVNLSNTQASACDQATNVSSNASFDQGAFALVGTSAGVFCAPGITSCFGEQSQANVNFGVQPAGTYVLWDITWTGADLPNGNPKGVTHFLDGYNPQTNPNAFVNISFKPTGRCATTTQTNCWVATTSTKTSFEAVFRTPSNGVIRGF